MHVAAISRLIFIPRHLSDPASSALVQLNYSHIAHPKGHTKKDLILKGDRGPIVLQLPPLLQPHPNTLFFYYMICTCMSCSIFAYKGSLTSSKSGAHSQPAHQRPCLLVPCSKKAPLLFFFIPHQDRDDGFKNCWKQLHCHFPNI